MSDKSKNKANPKNKSGKEKNEKGKPDKIIDPKTKSDPKNPKKHNKEREKHDKSQDLKMDTDVRDKEKPHTEVRPQLSDLRSDKDEVLILDRKIEIQSNWTRFELPLDNYDIVEESDSHGADFNELLQMPISRGGHFQFSHEKAWSDLKYISSALSCIPFYERNRLDPSHFSAEQLTRMKSTAEKNLERFKKNLPIDNSVTSSLLKALNEKEKGINVDNDIMKSLSDDEDMVDTFKIEVLEEPAKVDVEPPEIVESISSKVDTKKNENVINIDDDEELNEILGLSLTSLPKQESVSTTKITSIPSSIPKPLDSVKPEAADLDKWLDDFLDS